MATFGSKPGRRVEAPGCRCLARMRNIDTCNKNIMDITSLSLFLQNHVQPNTQMNHSMLRTKTSFTYQLYVANIKQHCPVLWSSFALPILKHILSIADCIHQAGHKKQLRLEDTEIQWRAEIFTLASIFIFFFFFLKTGRHGAAGSSLLEGWQGHEQKFTIHSPPVHCSCSSKNSSFWLDSDRNFLF